LVQFRLAGGKHVRHVGQPALHLGLRPHEFAEASLRFAGPARSLLALTKPCGKAGTGHHDDKCRSPEERGRNLECVAEKGGGIVHAGTLADFTARKRSKQEHLCDMMPCRDILACSIGKKDALWEAMTIKPLIILPDPLLRQASAPVEQVTPEILRLADDMLETMYDAPGIGLAAIQVGVPRQMLVIDVSREDEDKSPQVFINPEIVRSSDDRSVYEEGCLSIPDYYAEVERPATVTVNYIDRDG